MFKKFKILIIIFFKILYFSIFYLKKKLNMDLFSNNSQLNNDIISNSSLINKSQNTNKSQKKTKNQNSKTQKSKSTKFEFISEIKEDPNDKSYDSITDPIPVIIFDSEIHFRKDITEIDIIFLIDTTKSMNPFLKGIKRFIRKLLFDVKKTLSQYEVESILLLQMGIVAYRDHDEENLSYVSKILCDLTEDKNEFREKLYSINVKGGKDDCEAVLDGLDDAVNKINWREKSLKFIYHICGSPPHGNDINGGINDNFPNGCPCGKKYKDIILDLRGKGIDYTVVVLGNGLDTMIAAFSRFSKIDVMMPNFLVEDFKDGIQD